MPGKSVAASLCSCSMSAAAGKPKAAVSKVDNSRLLGSIRFTPCTLAKGADSLMAYCGTLQVPENHDAPDGRKITLAISWLPASGEAEPDPIFMLAGGPGQGARGSFPMVSGAFIEARRKRHIILLDQRGTGDSNPLKCVNEQGESAVVDDEDYSADAATDFAKRCAAQFEGKVDVAQFSSSDAIRDLDAARKALGAEQINLIGISYGTRMAQLYGKRYPQHTRTITIDGTNIQEFELSALRKHIGVVLQDVFLFSDTIANNISLYHPNITKEQMLQAAEQVGAKAFIDKLPGGFDYQVMERGATLSTGQAQLLSFIRAMVYNPAILVLDEATSSVDTATETLIQDAVLKLMKGRTCVVIAHRLSTIQHADKIIVLDAGEIKESGTHQELLKLNGYYKTLYQLQFSDLKKGSYFADC